VKRLWDEDSRDQCLLKVMVLGSAPLRMHQGLTESLAGRFEVLRPPHRSFNEMREAFGWSLDQYLFHGGYPGASPLIGQSARWARYLLDSLVETGITCNVLLLSRVDKPVLLRRLFPLGGNYSEQTLSFTKMVGQLQDAGNTVTLSHYPELLSAAGMVVGRQKYVGESVRQHGSSPKPQVLNTAFRTAQTGLTLKEARATLSAIEVRSGLSRNAQPGLADFTAKFKPDWSLLVGGTAFRSKGFMQPGDRWVKA